MVMLTAIKDVPIRRHLQHTQVAHREVAGFKINYRQLHILALHETTIVESSSFGLDFVSPN